MIIRRSIVTVLAAASLAVPALSFGQSERGSITGVVTDTTKAAVPGVSVKVVNTATNVTTNLTTSESGTYSATNLPPGVYKVEAALQGFNTYANPRVEVVSGASTPVSDWPRSGPWGPTDRRPSPVSSERLDDRAARLLWRVQTSVVHSFAFFVTLNLCVKEFCPATVLA